MRAAEVVEHYRARRQDAAGLREAWDELRLGLEQTLGAVEEQERDARAELAHAYLPRLDRPTLDALVQLTGFLALSRRDPLTAMARETKVLHNTVARIAADERYQRREYLVGPHGEIRAKLVEAEEMLDPWEQAAARFEDQEGFGELVQAGYDTPAFSVGFWEPRYWRYWATGDRICADLGMDDFGDEVLPAWRAAVAKRDPWRAEVARIQAQVDEVHELVREHDHAVQRIPTLPDLYLEASVKLVTEFLHTADYALLDEWARSTRPDDRPIRMGLRRAAGLRAKLEILRELRDDAVLPMLASLEERMGKYTRKITKYQRPKRRHLRFSDADLDRKFEAKAGRYLARRDKLQRLVERIHRYDSYDRFDLANPPALWFVEITGKRPPSQMTRLRAWYDAQFQGTVAHDDWDAETHAGEAVAAVAVTGGVDDLGYLS